MEEAIIQIMNSWGYLGIFLLIMLENIFPPIPSEVILTLGGFMTTYTNLKIVGVILVSVLGSTLGAIILYFVGRIFNKERLERIVEGKIGKVLHFKKEDIENANTWFEKRGYLTVFFCRFIPIVRSLISIPAGMTKMKIVPFLLLTIAGSTIWNSVLIGLGVWAGASWQKISNYVDGYSKIVLVILIIACIGFGIWFIKNRLLKKEDVQEVK